MGNYYHISTLLLIIHLLLLVASSYLLTTSVEARLTRRSFPKGFQFGTASSAYQYEGATHGHGRGSSIWDTFTRTHPEKIADHSTGDIAEDFYNRFKEDIALMKYIGYDSFRFSISWSRLLPGGKISRGVNQEGVKFYNNLIDELLSNGLQPLVTLFHWDLPQTLEDEYGGFLSPKIVNDYRDYVEFCFKEFGDRVKKWITFNEPNMFGMAGYSNGTNAPGRCSNFMGNCSAGNSGTEPYIVVHHIILAHAVAVNLYRQKYQVSQNEVIGITVMSHWMIPKFETTENLLATFRALDFSIGWILDPIMMGGYPKTMRLLVRNRLPKFTKEESTIIKGSVDFVGLNYYTTMYVEDASTYPTTLNLSYSTDAHIIISSEKNGILIGQPVSQNEVIGITVMSHWMIPKFETTENLLATIRALDFSIGWILDPIMMGGYPKTMRLLVRNRLPKFTKEESTIIRGSIDFVGLNYYTARYVEDATYPTILNLSYSTDARVITSSKFYNLINCLICLYNNIKYSFYFLV
ncbi:beta-glucosidase 17-like [Humulus lupulus]|uniref:beta-glucosidase 17-like n=1 Tax=Humulus lupulus TaxID=3486 RepID=UPI002B40D96B|nr:beta-glucosidase 17-like [Humulus lupulus]